MLKFKREVWQDQIMKNLLEQLLSQKVVRASLRSDAGEQPKIQITETKLLIWRNQIGGVYPNSPVTPQDTYESSTMQA